jgi:hypothetical protein
MSTRRLFVNCGFRAVSAEGDPVRVKVAGVEVEGRIVEIAAGVMHVRIGRRLF